MNKRKIIILMVLFVAVAGFCLAPASAATKTVKFQPKNYKYYESVSFYTKKTVSPYKIQITNDYNLGPKSKYFENIVMSVESKKKFKSATFYLSDINNNKLKKKYNFKAKYEYVSPGSKAYRIHKVKWGYHNLYCSKVVIKS